MTWGGEEEGVVKGLRERKEKKERKKPLRWDDDAEISQS